MEPANPSLPPPRYTDRPLPAYRHIPGQTPHPTRHPDGHSYAPETWKGIFTPAEPLACEEYLFAIDLHNAGYYWETHETLEGIWRTFDRGSETALFLQGLIQLSVAHSHAYHRGRPDLGIKLAGWALDRWAKIAQEVYGGIDLVQLRLTTVQWRLDPKVGAIGWRLV